MSTALLLSLNKPEFRKKILDSLLILIPGILAVVFLILVIIDIGIQQDIQNLTIKPNPFLAIQTPPYPVFNQETDSVFPTISAQSAIIMDKDSHVVIYDKNSNFRFSPASTTKIMTAYTALQHFHLHDVMTVKRYIDSQGSGLGLIPGEKITFESLLKAALIYSANDAAITIADNYPGGEDAFVEAMNTNAKKLHLTNTHYGDPAGLLDDKDYTTVVDLVRLSAIAMENPIFAHIVGMKHANITNLDGNTQYEFDNRNVLLGYDGINGIKTGYTDEAGEVLVTSLVKNGHTYYIVVMRSQDRFADTRRLLPILDQVNYISFDPSGNSVLR